MPSHFDAPDSSVKSFAELVLGPLVEELSLTFSENRELMNKEQHMQFNWIQEAEGRTVAIKLLRATPSWHSLTTEWVGWAKHLTKEMDARLLLVVTELPKASYSEPDMQPPYDPDQVNKLLRLLHSRPDEGLSIVNSALGLDCFWLVDQKRIVTVSYQRKSPV